MNIFEKPQYEHNETMFSFQTYRAPIEFTVELVHDASYQWDGDGEAPTGGVWCDLLVKVDMIGFEGIDALGGVYFTPDKDNTFIVADDWYMPDMVGMCFDEIQRQSGIPDGLKEFFIEDILDNVVSKRLKKKLRKNPVI